VCPRIGVDVRAEIAFELSRNTPKSICPSATEVELHAPSPWPYWDMRVEEMAKAASYIKWDKYHIDILTALVRAQAATRFNVGGGVQPVRLHPVRPGPWPAPAPSASRRPATSIRRRKYPSVCEPG